MRKIDGRRMLGLVCGVAWVIGCGDDEPSGTGFTGPGGHDDERGDDAAAAGHVVRG